MPTTLTELLSRRREELIAGYCDYTIAEGVAFYVALPRAELYQRVGVLVDYFIQSTSEGELPLLRFLKHLTALRAQQGASVDELQQMATLLRRTIYEVIDPQVEDPAELLALTRQVELLVEAGRMEIARGYARHFEAIIANLSDREQTIQLQNRVINELSTPVLPLLADVLVLPLIGAIDSVRADQITKRLLQAVELRRARVVIMDITAVPVVDIGIAQHLLVTVRAVGLLGAEVVLVGVRPEVAQALVSLGVDLSAITTRRDLQAGVLHVLRQRNLAMNGTGVDNGVYL